MVGALFCKLFLTCCILLATLAIVFSASNGEPRADFTYVNPSGIHTLDPARMSWTQDFRVALNIWEGLTSWDPQTLEPIAASAHFPPDITADGLTYTFRLRDDARWSNGDPVTSDDFIRGWRRAVEPGTAADYAFLLTDNIAGLADYVAWRNDAVNALSVLRFLHRGGEIAADQLRRFVRNPQFVALTDDVQSANPLPSNNDTDAVWLTYFENLRGSQIDWTQRAQHLLHDHSEALDARFATVGLSAPDPTTLVVQLRQPCPYFLDLTGFATFLPIHKSIDMLRTSAPDLKLTEEGLVAYDPQWTKPNYHQSSYPGIITNGPYTLADWTFKRRARMRVNPYYRDSNSIACKTIDMLEYENVSASILAYEAGDVDFLTDLGVPYQHELVRLAQSGARPDFKICNVLATQFLNFNCESKSVEGVPNPFRDPRVRRAFTLATDRDRIVQQVLARGDRTAYSSVPPGAIPGYTPPTGLPFDIDRANALLREAGYASGAELPPIELLVTSRTLALGEAIAHMWEQSLGVTVQLRGLESKTFAEEKINRNFMVARASWYADYNDATTFLDCLRSGNGNNDAGYASPEFDGLLDKAKSISDSTERARLLADAESLLLQVDCPILPISHASELIAVSPRVSGIYANARLWFPFRYVKVNR